MGARRGGGARVSAPSPLTGKLKKNCFAIWGSVCYFYTMWDLFATFFYVGFFSGLPPPPLRKLLRAPILHIEHVSKNTNIVIRKYKHIMIKNNVS